MRGRQGLISAIGVYVVVVVSLQMFLLMVGLEAFLTHDARVAWAAAVASIALAAVAAFLYRYLRLAARR